MKRIFACVVLILVVTALALPTFAVEGIQVEDSLHVSAETIEDIQKEFRLQNIENAYKVYNVYILSAFGEIECNSIIDALESGAVHGEIYGSKQRMSFRTTGMMRRRGNGDEVMTVVCFRMTVF